MSSSVRRGLVVVRGAGDLATGTILRLLRSGFRVIALEIPTPLAIRRTVALCEAVYRGEASVEGQRAALVQTAEDALSEALAPGGQKTIPILVDPTLSALNALAPEILVDAIIAKRNLGTKRQLAEIVIALGPGFSAPRDAHAVIETMRGHYLGRVIEQGECAANTGVPGEIGGKSAERVVHLPRGGTLEALAHIGDLVRAGDPLFKMISDPKDEEGTIVSSPLTGVLRGLIHPGIRLPAGIKVADVDPRGERNHCFSVSDKALAIAGGVLEAILAQGGRPL